MQISPMKMKEGVKAEDMLKKVRRDTSSDSDCAGLVVVSHALSSVTAIEKNNWIIDSGATCHMCNNEKLFLQLKNLNKPQEVKVGDGYSVEAKGEGTIELKVEVNDVAKRCKLYNVLYVPDLSYNLLSVSKAVKSGKVVEFSESGCQIVNQKSNIIATSKKIGSLYYLNCAFNKDNTAKVSHTAVFNSTKEKKDDIWHSR